MLLVHGVSTNPLDIVPRFSAFKVQTDAFVSRKLEMNFGCLGIVQGAVLSMSIHPEVANYLTTCQGSEERGHEVPWLVLKPRYILVGMLHPACSTNEAIPLI
jgi:hypothetical protein